MKPQFLGHARSTKHGAAPAVPLKAFIAYADLPAVRRAMVCIGDATRTWRRKVELHPMFWRAEQLTSPHWAERAIAAALEANIVVLTSSTAAPIDPALERWVNRLVRAACGKTMTLVIVAAADAWTIALEQAPKLTLSNGQSLGADSAQAMVA